MIIVRGRPRVRSLLVLLVIALALVLLARPAAAAQPLATAPDLSIAFSPDPAVLWPLLIAAGLLGLKFVLGVAVAYRDGKLDARQLPVILRTNVLPYLMPLAAMAALSVVMPAIKALYLFLVGLYVVKLIADLKDAALVFYNLTKPPEAA